MIEKTETDPPVSKIGRLDSSGKMVQFPATYSLTAASPDSDWLDKNIKEMFEQNLTDMSMMKGVLYVVVDNKYRVTAAAWRIPIPRSFTVRRSAIHVLQRTVIITAHSRQNSAKQDKTH